MDRFATRLKFFLSVFVFGFLPATCKTGDATPREKEPIRDYDLPAPAGHVRAKMREDWMKATSGKCLKAANIRLSCGGCTGATIPVLLRIDARGRLRSAESQNGRICGELRNPAIERCFIAPFETMQFPEELYNLEFLTRLGTGLSC